MAKKQAAAKATPSNPEAHKRARKKKGDPDTGRLPVKPRTTAAKPQVHEENGNEPGPPGTLFEKRLESRIHNKLDKLAHQLSTANAEFAEASRRVQGLQSQIAAICEENRIDGKYSVGDLVVVGKHTPDKWTAKIEAAKTDE